MRKILIILFLTILSLPLSLEAGQTGILKGKVLDAEGKPALGATVRVLGTNRGAVVNNADGSFTIVNIDGGTYTVKVTLVGFPATELRGVKISADNTTDVEIVMQEEKGVVKDDIIIVANREMVNANTVGQVRKMDAEEIQSISREGIAAIIGMTAGVVASGNSYSIRGSRAEETTVKVDGINKTNKFSGGGVSSGITEFDTEEIQVRTGGMGAEYGGAMGGVVNTVMKRGRTDRYEGYIRYRTDVEPLFGSQASGKKLVYDDARGAYKAVESGDGAKLQGPGQHRFAFGTGGPLPYLTGSTFYVSSNYSYRQFNGASYEIYDPWGNNLGKLPNDQNWNKNIAARLRFNLMSGLELNLGVDYGTENDEGSSSSWLYSNDEGIVYDLKTMLPKLDGSGNPITNGIPERIAKLNVYNQFTSTLFARLNHTVSPTSYYQVTVSYSDISEESSRRVGYEDPSYFTGYELLYPQDKYSVDGSILVEGAGNNIIDYYEIIKKATTTKDGYGISDYTQINPLTGYIEGQGDASGTNNPWGRQYSFYTHGAAGGFSFRESKTIGVDGLFEKTFDGEFDHTFRSGFEFYYYTLARHQNGNPYDGNPFFDVYTDEWGGNLYAQGGAGWERTSKPYTPIEAAAFVMDQISYKGIIISPSLRFDMFMPNADYRTESSQFVSITADSGFASSAAKYQISPRINISYPITDKSYFSISYGMYFQMPVLSTMYDGFATIRLRGNQILGDPNMEAQKTNQYEVNYNNQISDDIAITVAAYYKDVYNQLGQVYVPAIPIPYFQYSVSEYGNSKGLEFTIMKRATIQDHFGFRLNYTLSQSVATSSSPGDNYMTPIDPYSEIPAFPLAEFPTAGDIRHRIANYIDFRWENDQGPSIAGIYPLENAALNFTTSWRSGAPYTKTDLNGRAIGEIRTERSAPSWSTDMRITKQFPLKDWFGESMRNTAVEFSFFVYNVFNLTSAVGLYTSTNDADDPGLAFRRKLGDFSATPFYKDADFSNISTYMSTQYDNYGNRLYSKEADTDGNNVVSQQEKFDSYLRQLEQTSVQFQGNYQAPRSVFFTMFFRF